MLNFWPNIAIFQLYRNYVVSPSEPDLLFFYIKLHFLFFFLRNHITNDMCVGYFMAVMQEGKELKCINEQKSLGTSILSQGISYFVSNLTECKGNSLSIVK